MRDVKLVFAINHTMPYTEEYSTWSAPIRSPSAKNARRIGKRFGKIFPYSFPFPLCKERPEEAPAVLWVLLYVCGKGIPS